MRLGVGIRMVNGFCVVIGYHVGARKVLKFPNFQTPKFLNSSRMLERGKISIPKFLNSSKMLEREDLKFPSSPQIDGHVNSMT